MVLTPKQLRRLRSHPLGGYNNRLAAAIQLTGTVQAEMARTTGLSQQYISDVANGRFHTITVERAHIFADYFGCLIEDLFPRLKNGDES
jgi:transcriptional regulator with XRE-family HTH domain